MTEAEVLPPAPAEIETAEPSPQTLQMRRMVQLVAANFLIEKGNWVRKEIRAEKSKKREAPHLREAIYKQLWEAVEKENPTMLRLFDAAEGRRITSPIDLVISAIRAGAPLQGETTPVERIEAFTEEYIN